MANFLCLASYFKGEDFLRYCKNQGNTVYLVTSKALESKPWPKDSIDEIFYIQEDEKQLWNIEHLISGTASLLREREIDSVVALDDFDIENAAAVREAFRIPGMGLTTAKYFRDKLAMRTKAVHSDIKVPPFSALFNDAEIASFLVENQPPWLIKPRGEASAVGIEKCYTEEQVWNVLDVLGQERYNYLIEGFIEGDVYHVDSLSFDGKAVFSQVSQYLETPMRVAHSGGIFRTKTLSDKIPFNKALRKVNQNLLKAFGMEYSASHAEFIYSPVDKKFYFVEIASRVGGAHISDMIQVASNVNIWGEWAIIEDCALKKIPYKLENVNNQNAGLIISLSRDEKADYSAFNAPEVAWKLSLPYHIGLIISSPNQDRVDELMEKYTTIIQNQFFTSAPITNQHAL